MTWLDSEAARLHLGFRTRRAFLQAYVRLGIPAYRLGRSLRFRVADLDAALTHTAEVTPVLIHPNSQNRTLAHDRVQETHANALGGTS